ncbi:RNA polymerase sigma factor [Runella sp.]|uniref:RNA polymerase sigma factor n=1 Tax=Runella sp. TaxID=1960881 RepID=UPI003D099A39
MATVQETFIQLLDEYKAIIYKIAAVYAVTDEGQKDLFQEIVINLWTSYESFRGESKISTWLYRIALNTAITNYRRNKHYQKQVDLTHQEAVNLPNCTEVDWSEETALLQKAIQKLTAFDKAIILLYLEEKSYQEISAVIGISSPAVGMRIKRIKEKLILLLKTTNL